MLDDPKTTLKSRFSVKTKILPYMHRGYSFFLNELGDNCIQNFHLGDIRSEI